MADKPTTAPDTSRELAALDLGSNSFHLLVVQETNGRIQVLDKLKEMVRLADGLNEDNHLSKPVAARALDCLGRFGQRLRGFDRGNVRVVGTNTLRRASDSREFFKAAEQALGHEVEIISGREEARLIYLGVSHSLEDDYDRRLVVDIGGGSTELILGRNFDAQIMESLYVGCVGVTKACFGDGRIRQSQLKAAIDIARLELEPIVQNYLTEGWDSAIGASGTILAVQQTLSTLNPEQPGITQEGLDLIKKAMLDAKSIDKIDLPGVPSERVAVFPGGVAILCGVFESLGIEHMQVSTGALREGVIYDLLGRVQQRDVRQASVEDLIARYRIDTQHARRIRESAIALLAQVAEAWELTDPRDQMLLGWAADLHEIGMDIAHSQYHKHGGYLLQNMELPGFSKLDQQELATLVRAHRRKFPLEAEPFSPRTIRLAVLLRIAVVLHRSRTAQMMPHIAITAKGKGDKINLGIPTSWLKDHPLTRLDLSREARYLSAIPLELEISPR